MKQPPYLIVHNVAIGLGGGGAREWSDIIDEFVSDDAQRPPVTADPIVCRVVQTGQNLGGYVLRSSHWQTRLQLHLTMWEVYMRI